MSELAITLYCNSAWLPPDGMTTTYEHALTAHLIGQQNQPSTLAPLVASSLEHVYGVRLGPGVVIIDPVGNHPWAQNLPDLHVVFHTDFLQVDPQENTLLRYAVARLLTTHLNKFLWEFAAEHSMNRPSLKVECNREGTSGIALDTQGRVVEEWGVPKWLNRFSLELRRDIILMAFMSP